MGNRLELAWSKFNRLQVISYVWVKWKKMRTRSFWLCKCDCWKTCEVEGNKIKSWDTKSCWCLMIEKLKASTTTHWASNTKIYNVYRSIKQRCNDKNRSDYMNYGWRWIINEWKSYEEFYSDMWESYKDWLTIERNDVNWNYSKENCRWATMKEQANNKRNTRILEYKWIKHTIWEWSDIRKIKRSTISQRFYSYGWTIGESLGFN